MLVARGIWCLADVSSDKFSEAEEILNSYNKKSLNLQTSA